MKKIALIAAIVVVALLLAGYKFTKPDLSKLSFGLGSRSTALKPDDAKAKALDYINKNLVQPGTQVDIKNIAEENGLYKLDLAVGSQPIIAYMTLDGKTFFPQGMDMTVDPSKQVAGDSTAQPAKEIPKSDKPDVKLFVMSYCPYGTQMEKGILPVLDALGNKINFKLEFVSYAMHDKKELDENLRQYCIEKNEPAKLQNYLACFLKKGQGTENDCMNQSGINATQVAGCADATDKQFKVTESYNDKSTWNNGQFPKFDIDKADNDKYGVQGSPTLVINDTQASDAGRDPASILKTICSAFNTAPDACNQQLSSASPAPGFGEGTDSSGSSASCGN